MAELVDQCDVVFHLAAAVGVRLIVESPVRTIETNVHGTEVVLAKANKKKKKVQRTRFRETERGFRNKPKPALVQVATDTTPAQPAASLAGASRSAAA